MAEPLIGVIGGSGLSHLAGLETAAVPETTTPWGAPSASPRIGLLAGVPVAFLPRHGVGHDIPPHRVNYRANLWALHAAGVRAVIGCNAVGSIAPWFAPGRLALPDQLIDYTWGREHTYWDRAGEALLHVEFTSPVHAATHAILTAAGADLALPPTGCGVYAVTQGPRLETAAEIRRLRRDGCDMVGMTLMPEAVLAAELDVPYACIAYSVNRAAGCGPQGLHDEMREHMATGVAAALALLQRALPALADQAGALHRPAPARSMT